MFRHFSLVIFRLINEKIFIYQREDGQWKVPKHVVDFCVINNIYIYIPPDSCVRQLINPIIVYKDTTGHDEPYEQINQMLEYTE